jgi:putative aminopeptidase FrvX
MNKEEEKKEEIIINFDNEETMNFMKQYFNNPSPSGFEVSLGSQKIFADYIRPFVSDIKLDNYGSLIATAGNVNSDYKVVIEAHADEIAWYVNYIDDKGFIRVIRNGGSDVLIAPSMRVNIHTRGGKKLNGVFGHPAIHIHKSDNHKVELETIFVDVGATSKQEVLDMGINIGDVITFIDGYFELASDKWICGRALDNKLGGFILSQVVKRIKERNIELPYQLVLVNSSDEETGLHGSSMNAQSIKPNVALVVDVTHDTTSPVYNEQKLGKTVCGDGGVFTVATPVHNNLLNFWRDSLDADKIKYQMSTSNGYTGTDTDSYAFSNGGVPSCLISIPLSFMHTTVEKSYKEDVEMIIESFISILKNIKENQNFAYTL